MWTPCPPTPRTCASPSPSWTSASNNFFNARTETRNKKCLKREGESRGPCTLPSLGPRLATLAACSALCPPSALGGPLSLSVCIRYIKLRALQVASSMVSRREQLHAASSGHATTSGDSPHWHCRVTVSEWWVVMLSLWSLASLVGITCVGRTTLLKMPPLCRLCRLCGTHSHSRATQICNLE